MLLIKQFSSFDSLSWGLFIGSLLFLGAFVWLLVDDRPIQERLSVPGEPDAPPALDTPGTADGPEPPKPPRAA